jgi:hypothetical protein
MNPDHTTRFRLSARAFHLLLSFAALAIVVGSMWLVALWADRGLRADLLQQARMVAMAVNPRHMATLNGTADDLDSPSYQMIKEQLTGIRLSNPACRFLYLMSRKPDGTIIIHVDSEPASSKDYSPPGQVVKRCLRETDFAYRYGGEEFTILLPMTTSTDGAVTAERIRTEFKKETFSPAPGQDVHVTVSIGLAQYRHQEEMKAFVHRVDQLMYQGKKSGKDRVYSTS